MKMYDSTTASDIPEDAPCVAGYVDGNYKWSDADWERFPDARKVRIAVFASTNDGDCLDVENGDATVDQAPVWVRLRREAGVDPACYTSASNWQHLRGAFSTAGVAEPHWWIAQWDDDPTVPPGAVAKQYANPDQSGGHYDLSEVTDGFAWPPGKAPAPPQPLPPKEIDVQVPQLREGARGGPVVMIQATLNAKDNANLATDSIFGPATDAAVRSFQSMHGLAVDGIVGPITWQNLADR
jgi:hypothetical protein